MPNRAIDALLAKAASQIGGYFPGNSPYGEWYANKVGNSVYRNAQYCAMFVSWCAEQVGLLGNVIPLHAYTPSGAAWFKARKQFTPGVRGIHRGAIWYSSNAGLGRVSHVGFVERVYADGSFDTIEGNTSITAAGSQNNGRRVARKRRNSAGSLGGYASPAYPTSVTPAPTPTPTPVPPVTGSAENVKVQEFLRGVGLYSGLIDGVNGPMQKQSVAKFQTDANRFGDAGLRVDSDFGSVTWAWTNWVIAAQTAVKQFATLGGTIVDGYYAAGFNNNVKTLQRRNNLYPDGILKQKTIDFMRSQKSSIPNRP